MDQEYTDYGTLLRGPWVNYAQPNNVFRQNDFVLQGAEEALRKEAGLDSVSSEISSGNDAEPDLSNVLSEYERYAISYYHRHIQYLMIHLL